MDGQTGDHGLARAVERAVQVYNIGNVYATILCKPRVLDHLLVNFDLF